MTLHQESGDRLTRQRWPVLRHLDFGLVVCTHLLPAVVAGLFSPYSPMMCNCLVQSSSFVCSAGPPSIPRVTSGPTPFLTWF